MTNSNAPNNQNNSASAIPVYTGNSAASGGGFTPVAGSVSAIATGGASIVAVVGPINGGYIVNPLNLAAQGIAAAENAYIDLVGTPGSTDGAANGTTQLLAPGQIFNLPALAAGVSVRLNAATTGHKFTIVVW